MRGPRWLLRESWLGTSDMKSFLLGRSMQHGTERNVTNNLDQPLKFSFSYLADDARFPDGLLADGTSVETRRVRENSQNLF